MKKILLGSFIMLLVTSLNTSAQVANDADGNFDSTSYVETDNTTTSTTTSDITTDNTNTNNTTIDSTSTSTTNNTNTNNIISSCVSIISEVRIPQEIHF